MSSNQLQKPPPFDQPIFAHLARSRQLLATSPLISSLELALTPLSEAVELLGTEALSLTSGEGEQLAIDRAGVRQLLDGLGQWLSSRGALAPTYTGVAFGGAKGGNLSVEG